MELTQTDTRGYIWESGVSLQERERSSEKMLGCCGVEVPEAEAAAASPPPNSPAPARFSSPRMRTMEAQYS